MIFKTKPVILFVAGAWHSPSVYGKVVQKLEALSYRCKLVPLPSVGGDPVVESMDEDIAAVRTAVTNEVDTGNEAVLVFHSYGGIPGTSSLEGLGKIERAGNGQKGGVTRLVYLSSFMVLEGETVGGKDESKSLAELKGQTVPPSVIIPALYNGVDETEAAYWTSQLKPHSRVVFYVPAKYAAWRKIPSVYLLCENDLAIPLAKQENMVRAAKDAGAEVETEQCTSGHSPFLSMPDTVVNLIRRAAGESILKEILD